MHGQLETPAGCTSMASDIPAGMDHTVGTMWGDEFGMCVDRFGIAWMVDIARPTG